MGTQSLSAKSLPSFVSKHPSRFSGSPAKVLKTNAQEVNCSGCEKSQARLLKQGSFTRACGSQIGPAGDSGPPAKFDGLWMVANSTSHHRSEAWKDS